MSLYNDEMVPFHHAREIKKKQRNFYWLSFLRIKIFVLIKINCIHCALIIKDKKRNATVISQVALYSGSLMRQGNPSPWSVTPYFGKTITQDMNFFQRVLNVACLFTLKIMHWFTLSFHLQPVLQKYLGETFVLKSTLVSCWLLTLMDKSCTLNIFTL